ncbi:hypothetical protein SAMN05660748_0675 [Blastococcus aggregatus]|uniref:Uncharacterized protein n=1 Tax=Blastococcus aggregatus TaxID=38502 RepID=A0A285UZE3_9ACTN|nr:hypothetical protein [Blastococcus aggregatus]SOC47199.1 hypothetical protein SAMN05660748_0675 [Blastococcus aggregatus]
MAISVYDVRDTFARPRLVLPVRRTAAPGAARRRPPTTALLTGLLAMVEAVGLLAVALHGLDGLLTAPSRPAGPVLAVALLVLAAWIVLAAGSGAAVIDGSGRRLLVGVAVGELVLLALIGVAAVFVPVALPLPGLLLLATAVPVGKLLLAGSPSVVAWLAAGPRPVERRPDPAAAHRVLATATLGVIGLALGAVALLGPVDQQVRTGETAATTVYQP